MRQLTITNKAILKLLAENKKSVTNFNKSKAAKLANEYIEKYKTVEKELQEMEMAKNAKIAEFKAYEARTDIKSAMSTREQLHNKINDISGLIKKELEKSNCVELGEFEFITNVLLSDNGKEITVEVTDRVEDYKESLRQQKNANKK